MNNTLEEKIRDQPKKTSLWEYAKVFIATESGGYIGANAGVYLSSILTKSNSLITTGVLSGDFVGATIGQLASYWYNNKEKFKDKKGKTQKLKLLKDFSKIIAYDIPITTLTYAATSQLTYQMVKNDWNKAAVAGVSSLTIITIWNSFNYFVYSIIKNDSDEKLIKRIGSKIKSFTNYFKNR